MESLAWFDNTAMSLVQSLYYIDFSVDGTVLTKILRAVFGIAFLFTIRFALKLAFGGNVFFDALRYFIIGICAMAVWPWLFRKGERAFPQKPNKKSRDFRPKR